MISHFEVDGLRLSTAGTPRCTPGLALAAVVAYWLLVAAFQHWSGAANAAFGGYPDEPSHYLSGLLFRDYLVGGLPASPLAFAAEYYTHMPFVAVGYWPPLFYGIEGLWMIGFGHERATVLLLSAIASALLSGTCFWLLVQYLGRAGAFLFGLLFLLMPAVQWSNRLIMVDTTFTLFCWWAGLAFGIWAKTGSRWTALLAGLLAAAGLLTKINSAYLFLLPMPFFLVARRWSLLCRPSFWIIPAVVTAAWGPWLLSTRELATIGFGGLVHDSAFRVAEGLGGLVLKNLNWFVLPALLGILCALRRERHNYTLLVCTLLPFCYAAFLLVARVSVEPRFLLPILAPSIVLAGVGLSSLASEFGSPRLPTGKLRILLAAASVSIFALVVGVQRQVQPVNQIRAVVEFLRVRGASEQASVLVPSNAEGPFIAEFAARDTQRPSRLLVRPLKLLAFVDWNAHSYQPRFQTPAELVALFDRFPVRYAVVPVELNRSSYAHDYLLKETLDAHPERWNRVSAPFGPWLVYERADGRSLSPREMTAFAREVLSQRLRQLSKMRAGERRN